MRREGQGVALLVFGSLLASALEAAKSLDASVANMRFIKPLDEALVMALADRHELLVTLEENSLQGGAGSAVNETLLRAGHPVRVLNLGLPDRFIDHASQQEQLAEAGLDVPGILAAVNQLLSETPATVLVNSAN
jgi:1-deoxy-D-xylulose-5-phosphate synthase